MRILFAAGYLQGKTSAFVMARPPSGPSPTLEPRRVAAIVTGNHRYFEDRALADSSRSRSRVRWAAPDSMRSPANRIPRGRSSETPPR